MRRALQREFWLPCEAGERTRAPKSAWGRGRAAGRAATLRKRSVSEEPPPRLEAGGGGRSSSPCAGEARRALDLPRRRDVVDRDPPVVEAVLHALSLPGPHVRGLEMGVQAGL